MNITIVSKKGCTKCEAAKKKMKDFNIPYNERDIYSIQPLHDDWRNDGTTDIMAKYYYENTLPVFIIDSKYLSYPEAMKTLKPLMVSKPTAAQQ